MSGRGAYNQPPAQSGSPVPSSASMPAPNWLCVCSSSGEWKVEGQDHLMLVMEGRQKPPPSPSKHHLIARCRLGRDSGCYRAATTIPHPTSPVWLPPRPFLVCCGTQTLTLGPTGTTVLASNVHEAILAVGDNQDPSTHPTLINESS